MVITLATLIISSIELIYPLLTGVIINSVIERNIYALHNIIFLLIGLVLVHALINIWHNFWLVAIGERIVIDLRIQLYSHLQRLPLSFFQENNTGELLSRLTNDVALVRTVVTYNLIAFAQDLITSLLGLVVVIIGPDVVLAQATQFNLLHLPTSHATTGFGPMLLLIVLGMSPLIILPLVTSRYLRSFVPHFAASRGEFVEFLIGRT